MLMSEVVLTLPDNLAREAEAMGCLNRNPLRQCCAQKSVAVESINCLQRQTV
jgi:hypothetical protein